VIPGLALREHEPLAPRTTLGVGGPARYLVEAATEEQVAAALAWAGERAIPTLVLGGGSNLLVADRGFDGLVLRVRVGGVRFLRTRATYALVEVGAGERWDDFVASVVAGGWGGVEALSGIPGDVGATPIQNVGAYGQEVAETIVRVRAVERRSGRIVELSRKTCGFGYRDSVFKRERKDRHVIVAVRFALRPGARPLRYPELAARLAGAGSAGPSPAQVREAVLALRRSKSMVLDPADENGRSAGSFFMNPTLDAASLAAVRAQVAAASVLAPGEAMPEFAVAGDGAAGPTGEPRTKLSAGWLIERAGFRKGTGEGRVGLSTRHALAVVNRGGATAAEIVAFARRVREGVRERFGVTLAPEPVLVGFSPGEVAGLVEG
jgi:UDP-N-acetylmuramate dehydrogenase